MSSPRPLSQQKEQSATTSAGPRAPRVKTGSPERSKGLHLSSKSEAAANEERLAISSSEVQRFIAVLLAHDEQASMAYAKELTERGLSADELYEGLFAQAARTMGDMWSADDCSFYDVTVGTGRIHRLIREFSHQFLTDNHYPGATGRVLLSCANDEQHSLGIAVLAEFFVRDGWDVQIGPGLGSEGLLDKVRESDYNLLGFSVSVSSRISKLQQDIRRARQVSRNRDIRVMVGGQLITSDPSLAERIGADGYALDARTAIHEARRLLSA